MGMPESVDKDKFVKIWLKEGGIQDLFDKRLAEVKRRDMDKEKTEQPDYLKEIFEAIEKANREMNKYGVTLQWEFKIAPYLPVTKGFPSNGIDDAFRSSR
jgi:hypothetical protein